jgi:hypothetical protein
VNLFSVPRIGVRVALAAALLFWSSVAVSASFYASPTGTTSTAVGTGTITTPWALRTALSGPAAVHPGDTIWVRGGTYAGLFTSWLTGTSSAPIIVRAYPGERVTLSGTSTNGGSTPVLTVNGDYSWFWGFEITTVEAAKGRVSDDGQWAGDLNFGDGIDSSGTGTTGVKLINLVIHDTRAGLSLFSQWTNTEVYGCLVYYNGYTSSTGSPTGHGFYVQNNGPGYKKILETVTFQNFGMNIQVYGSGAAYIDNVDLEGNVYFLPGDLNNHQTQNFILGGGNIAQNPIVKNNFTFTRLGKGSLADFSFGYDYGEGTNNGIVQNNYIASGALFSVPRNMTMTGNTFTRNTTLQASPQGRLRNGVIPGSYPANTYLGGTTMTGTKVFVRPNAYEAGRANVIVYNWSRAATVAVDLSGVLSIGSSYEVRNVQNFFGSPVASGVYGGGTLDLPMTSTVSAPLGFATPAQSGPDFNAFVVLTTPGLSGAAVKLPGRPLTAPKPRRSSLGSISSEP